MRHKTGFTLIELMIVIAIIAILAAILFPVFNQARKKSLQASCISNLRQLTTAMKMYATDNDDQFPYALYDDLARNAWHDVIYQGYVNNDQIYNCPANSLRMGRLTGVNVTQSRFIRAYEGYAGIGESYGLNAMEPNATLNPPITTGGPAGMRQGAIEDASGTILMCDAGYNTYNTSPYVIYTGAASAGDYRLSTLYWEIDVNRHGIQKQLNAGYVDGHAKAVPSYERTIDIAANVNEWTAARYN
jgi:prepilin-type N-terminal cleavage/methylation domain-containing protein/prepilin-type processing-associated H-X9-DG protein